MYMYLRIHIIEYVLKSEIAFLQINGSLEVHIQLDNYSQTFNEKHLVFHNMAMFERFKKQVKYLLRKETKSD